MQVHWAALNSETKELFTLLAKLPFRSEFYLGGGTGLALQIGHRFSVDLDFCSDSIEAVGTDKRAPIVKLLKEDPSFRIIHDKDGTFVANWRNVGVSFFRLEHHPLIQPKIRIDAIDVASIEDIGAMTLAAILSCKNR